MQTCNPCPHASCLLFPTCLCTGYQADQAAEGHSFTDFAAALDHPAVRDAPTNIDEAVMEGLFTGVVFALTDAAFEAAETALLGPDSDIGSIPRLLVQVGCLTCMLQGLCCAAQLGPRSLRA